MPRPPGQPPPSVPSAAPHYLLLLRVTSGRSSLFDTWPRLLLLPLRLLRPLPSLALMTRLPLQLAPHCPHRPVLRLVSSPFPSLLEK